MIDPHLNLRNVGGASPLPASPVCAVFLPPSQPSPPEMPPAAIVSVPEFICSLLDQFELAHEDARTGAYEDPDPLDKHSAVIANALASIDPAMEPPDRADRAEHAEPAETTEDIVRRWGRTWEDFLRDYPGGPFKYRGLDNILRRFNGYYAGQQTKIYELPNPEKPEPPAGPGDESWSNARILILGAKVWHRAKPRDDQPAASDSGKADETDGQRGDEIYQPGSDNHNPYCCLRYWGKNMLRHCKAPNVLFDGPMANLPVGASGATCDHRILKVRLHGLDSTAVTHFAYSGMMDVGRGVAGFLLKKVTSPGPVGTTEDAYLAEIATAVKEAMAADVHVLMFPELCVTERARHTIREVLETSLEQEAEGDLTANSPGELAMVVAGSYHRPTGQPAPQGGVPPHRNSGTIFARQGKFIAEFAPYAKLEHFSLAAQDAVKFPPMHEVAAGAKAAAVNPRRFKEHISAAPAYTIFNSHLGVCAVLICKDSLDGAALEPLCRTVDHLLIVSMHRGGSQFEARLKLLADRFQVSCIYVNTNHVDAADDTLARAVVVTPRSYLQEHSYGRIAYRTQVLHRAKGVEDRIEHRGDLQRYIDFDILLPGLML